MTGSKHLLEIGDRRLLVDCGLFQGLKELRERNWQPLPGARRRRSTSVVLTHAHLDHCGYLPRLVAQGFKGRIFCTPATADLDAHRPGRRGADCRKKTPSARTAEGYTRHQPALPLFTEEDAERAMTRLQPVGYERPVPVLPGVTAEFLNAGHLLGSAYARLVVEATGKTLLFGGDLGRYSRPVLPDPTPVAEADVLLVESTYGNRTHEPDDDGAALARIMTETVRRGGKVIIPSFALGRVEELLYWINLLEDRHQIPELPVYVDSPMAATVLARVPQAAVRTGSGGPRAGDRPTAGGRRPNAGCAPLRPPNCAWSRRSPSPARCRRTTAPAIVISASGMATGGRVLHHLARALPDARNTVLFAGYQAAGHAGPRAPRWRGLRRAFTARTCR